MRGKKNYEITEMQWNKLIASIKLHNQSLKQIIIDKTIVLYLEIS